MKEAFENKNILVTGGCGSIGSEIVRQLLAYNPKSIRVYDNSEEGHFRLEQKLIKQKFDISLVRHLLGDVRDRERLNRAMEGVDIVFHSAALKHIAFCEYNPFEAVNTNVIGTRNLADAAIRNNVQSVIAISTDKAVNPINTMGATKLLSEKIITSAPTGTSSAKFCCVRFGNVLASSGSVIPIFVEQIKNGEEITITSKEMTRFFMTLADAASLVLKAASLIENGDTYILKMPALKITDLAEVLVEELAPKFGKKAADFSYKIIGVRPGEKTYEGLMTAEEAKDMTETEDMFILHNAALAEEPRRPVQGETRSFSDYCSHTGELLGKEEIRKMLREKRVIEELLA